MHCLDGSGGPLALLLSDQDDPLVSIWLKCPTVVGRDSD